VPRPRKQIPLSARKTVERLASTGASLVEIASALGIGKDLLRQWVQSNEDLSIALAKGREAERQALHSRLFKAAMDGNVVAAFFLLKCRHEGYDDRGKERDPGVPPEERARQIQAALRAMDESVGGKKPPRAR
jgi:hypothetical protein